MRSVSPLKTTYQRNMLLGTLIAAMIFFVPLMIWHLTQDHSTVIISVKDIREIGPGFKLESGTKADQYGSGPRANGRKGRAVKADGRVSGFIVVSDKKRPVATFLDRPDLALEPTPVNWIDESLDWYAEGNDEFEINPGTPDGDGWPIKPEGLLAPQSIGNPNLRIREIIEPKKNRKPVIQLGPQIWPRSATLKGYYTATIKVSLYMDEKGKITDKRGKLMCEVLEKPIHDDFRLAFFEMLRNGFYQNEIIEDVPYGYVCTIEYTFCNGPGCQSFVEVIKGDVVASVQKMRY